ncbi:MAG: hypothetical protein AB7T27_01910 [Kiritimatiellia bacterium]
MRTHIIAVAVYLVTSVVLAQHAVPTKATFVVRDDAGQAVTAVAIDGGFGDVSQSGARDRFNGLTDTNGMFAATGNAILDVGARFKKDGYYQSIKSVPVDRARRESGLRWDVEIPVLLKRIRNPIPMYFNRVDNFSFDHFERVGKYCLGRTSSYDFVTGAFLPPSGTGSRADVQFTWSMKIYATNRIGRALEYDSRSKIEMTNVMDGICKGKPDGVIGGEGSSCISAYEAPADGYTNAITLYRNVRGRNAESNDDQHQLYYFRIRTQTNEMGQVTNALYGKIYGQINGNFTYYLNPTPNDRNVEFDPSNNLFKNLRSAEQVREP